MRCPHCTVVFHENWNDARMVRGEGVRVTGLLRGSLAYWHYRTTVCSKCKDVIIEIAPVISGGEHLLVDWRRVYPIGTTRWPIGSEVPTEIAKYYLEDCNVLPISPKATAALS
jgi:hypothetical protein